MSDRDEFDWIFDYTLQFLESEKFDALVMNYVDSNCYLFENDDENKFVYTDVHNEFREHVESLIESNLGKLGITIELFYESCQKSRNNRHINQLVFERLTSIDDFQIFKMIMIRRNIELQIEAMQHYEGTNGQTPLQETDFDDEDMLQSALVRSLQELELLHKQVELDQAYLEQALALSLAMEEERLRSSRISVATAEDTLMNDLNRSHSHSQGRIDKLQSTQAEIKVESENNRNQSISIHELLIRDEHNCKVELYDSKHTSTISSAQAAPNERPAAIAEPKSPSFFPLPSNQSKSSGGIINLQPINTLPPISRVKLSITTSNDQCNSNKGNSYNSPSLISELFDPTQLVQNVLLDNQQQILNYRKLESELKLQVQLASRNIDPAEARSRAEFMSEQRERLIRKKHEDRQRRVKEEDSERSNINEKHQKQLEDTVEEAVQKVSSASANYGTVDQQNVNKRNNTRLALAQHLKAELLSNCLPSDNSELSHKSYKNQSDLNEKILLMQRYQNEVQNKGQALIEEIKNKLLLISQKN